MGNRFKNFRQIFARTADKNSIRRRIIMQDIRTGSANCRDIVTGESVCVLFGQMHGLRLLIERKNLSVRAAECCFDRHRAGAAADVPADAVTGNLHRSNRIAAHLCLRHRDFIAQEITVRNVSRGSRIQIEAIQNTGFGSYTLLIE